MTRAFRLGGGERAVGERTVVLTLSGTHALVHSTELAYAALLLRIEAEFGTDLLLLGVLANVSAFAFGLGALPAGMLADRLGSVHVLRITLAGSALAAVLVALSPSELALGVTLALLGITTGLYHPAGFALLARTRRRTHNVAMHGVVGTLGIAVAPVLLSGIALATDWRLAYVALGVLAAVGFLYTLRLPRGGQLSMGPGPDGAASPGGLAPEAGPETPASPLPGADPGTARPPATTAPSLRRFWWLPLAVVYVANVIQGFVYRGSITFIPTHIEEQITGAVFGVGGAELAGALATAALLGGAVGWYVGGILAERLPHYPLVIGAWLATIPLLLLISASGGAALIVVMFIFVVTNFAMAPALVSLIADFSPPGRMGASFGMMFFLSFGMGSFAATLAGFTADRWGVDAVFLVLAVVSGGGALLSVGLFYLTRGARRRPAAVSA